MNIPFTTGLKSLVLALAITLSAACAPKSAPGDVGAAPSAAADAPAASSGGGTAMPAANGQNDPFPACLLAMPDYSPQDISGTFTVAGEQGPMYGEQLIPPYAGDVTITKVQEHCFHVVWETDGPDRIATVTVRAAGTIIGDYIQGALAGTVSGDVTGDTGNFVLSENEPGTALFLERLTRK